MEDQQSGSGKKVLSRRNFLRLTAAAGAGLLASRYPDSVQQVKAQEQDTQVPEFPTHKEGGWTRVKAIVSDENDESIYKEIDDLDKEWKIEQLPDEFKSELLLTWIQDGKASVENFEQKLGEVLKEWKEIRTACKEPIRILRQEFHQEEIYGLSAPLSQIVYNTVWFEEVMAGRKTWENISTTSQIMRVTFDKLREDLDTTPEQRLEETKEQLRNHPIEVSIAEGENGAGALIEDLDLGIAWRDLVQEQVSLTEKLYTKILPGGVSEIVLSDNIIEPNDIQVEFNGYYSSNDNSILLEPNLTTLKILEHEVAHATDPNQWLFKYNDNLGWYFNPTYNNLTIKESIEWNSSYIEAMSKILQNSSNIPVSTDEEYESSNYPLLFSDHVSSYSEEFYHSVGYLLSSDDDASEIDYLNTLADTSFRKDLRFQRSLIKTANAFSDKNDCLLTEDQRKALQYTFAAYGQAAIHYLVESNHTTSLWDSPTQEFQKAHLELQGTRVEMFSGGAITKDQIVNKEVWPERYMLLRAAQYDLNDQLLDNLWDSAWGGFRQGTDNLDMKEAQTGIENVYNKVKFFYQEDRIAFDKDWTVYALRDFYDHLAWLQNNDQDNKDYYNTVRTGAELYAKTGNLNQEGLSHFLNTFPEEAQFLKEQNILPED